MGIQPKTKAGRNDPCPCGSKVKYKHCHGDPIKQMLCNRVANEHMAHLVVQEQKKRGIVPYNYKCESCGHDFDKPMLGQLSDLPLCPECQSTDLIENEIQNGGEDEKEGESKKS